MPPCAAAAFCFLFTARLVCSISAVDDPVTRHNPRGWAAAHQASQVRLASRHAVYTEERRHGMSSQHCLLSLQELLASLAAGSSSATNRLSAQTLPAVVSGEQERSSADSYDRLIGGLEQTGNRGQQLALPALALALLAFALGWCAAWQFSAHANARHGDTTSDSPRTLTEGPRMELLTQERTPPRPTTMQPVSVLAFDGGFSSQELHTGSKKTCTRLLERFEATESGNIASIGIGDGTSGTAEHGLQLVRDAQVASTESQPSGDVVPTEPGLVNGVASGHDQQEDDAASSGRPPSEQNTNAPAHIGQVHTTGRDCGIEGSGASSSTRPFNRTPAEAHPKQDASTSTSQPTQLANTIDPDGGSNLTDLPHGHGTTSASQTSHVQPPASTSAPGWLLSAQQKALTRQQPEAIDDVTVIMAALAQR